MTNDQTVTQALEPCPFCGGEGLSHRVARGWRVSCKNCDAQPRPGLPPKTEAEAITAWNTRTAHSGEGRDFQSEVGDWMLACFGEETAADKIERADRFIEEALELAQTIPGFTVERARALVEYVFARPVGERGQEVGGVGVTLAALCNTFDLNIAAEWERELARVWTKVEAIRAKQATKPVGSALPVAVSGEGRSNGAGEVYPASNWREQGYKSAEEENNDMAEVGRSLMDRLGSVIAEGAEMAGWNPMDDPAEIVTDMANVISELRAALSAPQGEVERLRKALAKRTFLTCVSGDGPTPYLKVHFNNLADAHAAHDELLGRKS